MSSPIVLAYSGSVEASAAVPWLAEACAADVVTLTLDIGQNQPVEHIRARALACGARRAHVVDVRDEFARDCVVSTMHAPAAGSPAAIARLARPLIARTLTELAVIEGASAVAHASRDDRFHDALAASNPDIRVLAPVREWRMDAEQLASYLRAHGVPLAPTDTGNDADHLLVRRTTDPARAPDGEARLELTFRDRVPVALNGVSMSAAELLESLSLIAGQYGIGWGEAASVPAAPVLRAACAALRQPAGVVTLRVSRGEQVVLAFQPALVSLA